MGLGRELVVPQGRAVAAIREARPGAVAGAVVGELPVDGLAGLVLTAEATEPALLVIGDAIDSGAVAGALLEAARVSSEVVARLGERREQGGRRDVLEAGADEPPGAVGVGRADGPERERLQRMVADLALGDVVTFHGRYSQDTLPGILSGADLYVSTSTSDAGIAASTAEAMASGLPVAISDSGENTAWITDGVNGRLFPTGNDEVLAAILEEAAANPERRRAWADAGQQTILQRNDHQTEMHKMETLYAQAANAAP